MKKLTDRILYPDECFICPHIIRENYGVLKLDKCIECLQLSKYGVYKTPSGELIFEKIHTQRYEFEKNHTRIYT